MYQFSTPMTAAASPRISGALANSVAVALQQLAAARQAQLAPAR